MLTYADTRYKSCVYSRFINGYELFGALDLNRTEQCPFLLIRIKHILCLDIIRAKKITESNWLICIANYGIDALSSYTEDCSISEKKIGLEKSNLRAVVSVDYEICFHNFVPPFNLRNSGLVTGNSRIKPA